ncbi:MAG: dTMP kinase [Rhabdochlamydiaceae bacterium]|nr:dTMP kinase [Rhabdochlamydiaceae bacterium]
MSFKPKRGLFITFEGGEGAGKTTLIESLHAHLKRRKIPSLQTRAPGGTPIGQKIRELVLSKHGISLDKRCELLLFLADRAQHVDEVIKPALKEKQIVLCDRFNDSTVAYQSGARGFDEKLVHFLCSFACDAVQPDLTLYLDLDPKIGFERTKSTRSGKDRIESETLKFHQKIRKAFHKIAKKDPKRFKMIDASKSAADVLTQAMEHIDAFLDTAR